MAQVPGYQVASCGVCSFIEHSFSAMQSPKKAEPLPAELDPAAVLALAISLREACERIAARSPGVNLSESYNGFDQFMRELMRVANLFEAWACAHVSFDELGEVWPYLMEDKFGDACLQCVRPDALAALDQNDCLRVALRLGLPVQSDDQLPVPVDVRATNIISGSGFREFRIQTVRNEVDGSGVVPFTVDDEPFDADFAPPHFALYGVGDDGLAEHIADRATYSEILSLAQKLAPGVGFPAYPVSDSHGRRFGLKAP